MLSHTLDSEVWQRSASPATGALATASTAASICCAEATGGVPLLHNSPALDMKSEIKHTLRGDLWVWSTDEANARSQMGGQHALQARTYLFGTIGGLFPERPREVDRPPGNGRKVSRSEIRADVGAQGLDVEAKPLARILAGSSQSASSAKVSPMTPLRARILCLGADFGSNFRAASFLTSNSSAAAPERPREATQGRPLGVPGISVLAPGTSTPWQH